MSAVDAAAGYAAPRRSIAGTALRPLKNGVVGTLLCLTPVTAVLVLGWLAARMRAAALRRLGRGDIAAPAWLFDGEAESRAGRWLGGLLANGRRGLGVAAGLGAATLPFGALWALSWWAGWENSFNKGYEQSGAGPLLGLLGVAIALPVLWYLPMALAHQAVEQRWRALFDIAAVRRLIAYAGWRYVALMPVAVALAFPLFLLRALPVFVEGIVPGFADLPAEQVEAVAGQLKLATAAWIFVSLTLLRILAGRLYGRAALRWLASGEGAAHGMAFAGLAAVPAADQPVRAPGRIGRLLRFAIGAAILFGLVAQIYVGQFLNHDWAGWLTHPHILLPWAR